MQYLGYSKRSQILDQSWVRSTRSYWTQSGSNQQDRLLLLWGFRGTASHNPAPTFCRGATSLLRKTRWWVVDIQVLKYRICILVRSWATIYCKSRRATCLIRW